jgi:hypothetical protein
VVKFLNKVEKTAPEAKSKPMKYLPFILFVAGCNTFGEVEPFEGTNLPDGGQDVGNNTTNNSVTNNQANNTNQSNNNTNQTNNNTNQTNNQATNNGAPSFPVWPTCQESPTATFMGRGTHQLPKTEGEFSTAWVDETGWMAWVDDGALKTASTDPDGQALPAPVLPWGPADTALSVRLRSHKGDVGYAILGETKFRWGLDQGADFESERELITGTITEVGIAGGLNPLTGEVEVPMRWIALGPESFGLYDPTPISANVTEMGLNTMVTSSGSLIALSRDGGGPVLYDVAQASLVNLDLNYTIQDLLYLGTDGSDAHYVVRIQGANQTHVFRRLDYRLPNEGEFGSVSSGDPMIELNPETGVTKHHAWFGVPGGFIQAWAEDSRLVWRAWKYSPLSFEPAVSVDVQNLSSGEQITRLSGHFVPNGCDGKVVLHADILAGGEHTLNSFTWDVANFFGPIQ